MTSNERVVLITGASSGIGAACARLLSERGYRVFGTTRAAPLPPAAQGFELIPVDVDSDSSVEQAVQRVMESAGRLHVVVNSAGYGLAGAVEETTVEEAKAQLETNFFGIWRVCRAVLPRMREQRGGYIVNIGSLGGRIGLPFQAAYCASKFALAGFTESLSAEVRPFGIHAVLIEPGNFATGITDRRQLAREARRSQAYRESFTRALRIYEADEIAGPAPEPVAHLLYRIINTPAPRLRYTVGPTAERLSLLAKAILPGRLFERLMLRRYGSG
ncbi:SDR family oxidoreductase [soil metagenome]|nr:SDR family oxidoreductase [Gemmatimonadota bacterium]